MALVHSFIWPSMADLITLKGLRRTQSPGVFEKKKNDKKTTPIGIPRSNPILRTRIDQKIFHLRASQTACIQHYPLLINQTNICRRYNKENKRSLLPSAFAQDVCHQRKRDKKPKETGHLVYPSRTLACFVQEVVCAALVASFGRTVAIGDRPTFRAFPTWQQTLDPSLGS